MRKVLMSVLVVLVALTGCKKTSDNNNSGGGSSGATIGAVPSAFVQKVLIEEFTGAWCGWCPDGAYKMKQIIDANPGKAIGAAVHQGDPMEINLYSTLDATFNVTGFPQGMISRTTYGGSVVMSRSSWNTASNIILGKTAKAGLAIESSIVGDSLKVKAHVAFLNALTGTFNVTIYLLEDKVTGGSSYNQSNYLSGNASYSSSPYYSLPNPITGYEHNHTVRKVLTANLGDAIPTSDIGPGVKHIKSVNILIPTNYKKENLRIVAFVTDGSTKEVLNAQEANAGAVKNWD
ncbi:MAG TPA: Omp28-related outer membrane protein [Bacteroidia bacterium]|nr:Omp28-related outer membrane protein [Bacteroidia bacterium]HNT79472.1 Omp28-related outer membrane protein [Bacteroidia bacterium]